MILGLIRRHNADGRMAVMIGIGVSASVETDAWFVMLAARVLRKDPGGEKRVHPREWIAAYSSGK